MRKIRNIGNLLFGLLFGLSSCETVVELELPPHKAQLVVNSVLNPDSLFTVDVSASRNSFQGGAYEQLPDATVQVYQAGQHLFDLEHTGKGIYKADRKPQALQHFQLRISAPGFPDASATSHIPASPTLTEIKTTQQGAAYSLSFTLQDAAGQENFYYMRAYTPDTFFVDNKPFNRTENLSFISPIEEEFTIGARYFFSDKLFDGKQIAFTLEFRKEANRTTRMQVFQITKEYYQYARTLEKQAGGDDFGKFPTAVTNNIKGGLGVFAGCNSVTLEVKP